MRGMLPPQPRMKFSIVIPSYQQAPFLRATLESVLSQEYPDREILVHDGGSTDGSVEILRELGADGGFRWVSGPDGGQAGAINAGLEESTGDILAYLNSDDIYYPRTLSRVAEYFAAHPDCLVLYGNADHLREDGSLLEPYPVEAWNYARLPQVCFLCQPAVFWRREVMVRFGPFDATLRYAIDYEYWLRVGKEVAFHHLDGPPLAGSRLHPGTKTLSQRVPAHKEGVRVVLRHGGERAAVIKWLRATARHCVAAKSPAPASPLGRALVYTGALFACARECGVPLGRDLFLEAARALVKRPISAIA